MVVKQNSDLVNDIELYVISCHIDRVLEENAYPSMYEIGIQAGAALTKERTQKLNDYDGLADSISDRNERYGEATAMYWIYRNSSAKYIGIEHYRRRFDITDDALKELINDDVDIVTISPFEFPVTLIENYQSAHYLKDWSIVMDILKRDWPDYYSLAESYIDNNKLYPCNMDIFRNDIFKEHGDWMYPILDEVYNLTPKKRDKYQVRDIGFISERLTSLFVEKKKSEGYKVVEVPMYVLNSRNPDADINCDLSNPEELYSICSKLYDERRIKQIHNILSKYIKYPEYASSQMTALTNVFVIAEQERLRGEYSLFEYLPDIWSSNLDTVIRSYEAMVNMLEAIDTSCSMEAVALFKEFLKMTNYSRIAILVVCIQKELNGERILALLDIKL